MGTGPRSSRSPRATPAGRSTSPPHEATAGGPARAPGTSRGAPGGPRGRATAEGRAGGGEQRPPLSPRSRGAGSRAVGRACCCGCDAGRPRLTLLLAHARPRLTFSHTRSRTLRLPSARTDQRRHTTASLTFSSQSPVCASPSIHSLYPTGYSGPSSLAPRTLALRQRLRACLDTIHSFQEAHLDDECAFYTSRAPPPGPTRVFTNPVVTTLEWQDALRFVPIGPVVPQDSPS